MRFREFRVSSSVDFKPIRGHGGHHRISMVLKQRELTLIRVACLQRLDRLRKVVPNEIAEDMAPS